MDTCRKRGGKSPKIGSSFTLIHRVYLHVLNKKKNNADMPAIILAVNCNVNEIMTQNDCNRCHS